VFFHPNIFLFENITQACHFSPLTSRFNMAAASIQKSYYPFIMILVNIFISYCSNNVGLIAFYFWQNKQHIVAIFTASEDLFHLLITLVSYEDASFNVHASIFNFKILSLCRQYADICLSGIISMKL